VLGADAVVSATMLRPSGDLEIGGDQHYPVFRLKVADVLYLAQTEAGDPRASVPSEGLSAGAMLDVADQGDPNPILAKATKADGTDFIVVLRHLSCCGWESSPVQWQVRLVAMDRNPLRFVGDPYSAQNALLLRHLASWSGQSDAATLASWVSAVRAAKSGRDPYSTEVARYRAGLAEDRTTAT
jgi:hypothetical protein